MDSSKQDAKTYTIVLTKKEVEALKLITHTLPKSVLEKVNKL